MQEKRKSHKLPYNSKVFIKYEMYPSHVFDRVIKTLQVFKMLNVWIACQFIIIFICWLSIAASAPFNRCLLALFVLPVGQNKAAKQLRASTRGPRRWPIQSEPFKTVTSFFLRGQKLEMKLTNKKKGWAG